MSLIFELSFSRVVVQHVTDQSQRSINRPLSKYTRTPTYLISKYNVHIACTHNGDIILKGIGKNKIKENPAIDVRKDK